MEINKNNLPKLKTKIAAKNKLSLTTKQHNKPGDTLFKPQW